jgi:hypothetical protein
MASIVWSHSSQAHGEEVVGDPTTLQPEENVYAVVSLIHATRGKSMQEKKKEEAKLSRSANLHLGLGLGKMLYSTPSLTDVETEQGHLLNKFFLLDRSGEREHKHTHKEERREHEQGKQVELQQLLEERCQRTVRAVMSTARLSQGNLKEISSQQHDRTWVPLGHLPPRSISPLVHCLPRHSNTGDAGDGILGQRQQVISPVAKDCFWKNLFSSRPSTPRTLHVQVCL